MHSAPAVSFPVGRPHFQGWIIGLAALLGCVVGLFWLTQVERADWRQGLFAISYLATCSLALAVWLRSPQGVLHWDGQAWTWTGVTESLCGELTVQLDLQVVLLVCLDLEKGSRFWLSPERQMSRMHWNDLRRAVFAKHVSKQKHQEIFELPMKQRAP